MHTSAHYRKLAEEAEALARKLSLVEHRDEMLQQAACYRRRAASLSRQEEEERRARFPAPSSATPLA
jgi:hypothetical protein